MAFTTLRGRPRKPVIAQDPGTPELRLKHALKITLEPIDLCLEKNLISHEQHWCGLHLRWLYTLRYGAPSLTTIYADRDLAGSALKTDDPEWRRLREQEYKEAIALLHQEQRYEPVMRLAVHNELPAFLNHSLRGRAIQHYTLACKLEQRYRELCEGLELLAKHWRKPSLA